MQGAVGIGPAAIVTGQNQGLHIGRKDEFRIGGVFLLDEALGGGEVLVHQAVLGAVRQHLAVGEAHGGVGVRVHGLAFLPLHEGGGKVLAAFVIGLGGAAVNRTVMFHEHRDDAVEQAHGRVFHERVQAGGAGLQFLIGGEDAAGKQILHICGNVEGGKIRPQAFQIVLRLGILPIELQQGHGLFLVQVHHIVAVLALHGLHGLLDHGQGIGTLRNTIPESGEHAGSQAHQLDAVGGLGEKGNGVGSLGGILHVAGDVFHRVSVEGLALRGSLNPGLQGRLFLFFPADNVQILEGQLFTLPFLPAVGAAGVLVGILELYGRVCAHGLPHEVLTHGAGVNPDAVGGNHLLELGGRLVTLGASGVAHDHGIVVLLDALHGHLQAAGGLVGNVLRAVIGRHVVLAGIHAEHGEVAGVTGPHPVVRLSAELAHGSGGSGHEAHVRIGAVHNQVIDIVVIEGGHLGAAAGMGFLCGLAKLLLFFSQVIGLFHHGGHVLHGNQEGNRKAGAGDFLRVIFGPVAVHQVVVLVRGEALDAAVAAVVIGHQQALGRYHLSGAAAAEVHDGVFQGTLVDGVNLFRGKLAAGGFEVFSVQLFQERQQPHSFIGHGAYGKGKAGQKS